MNKTGILVSAVSAGLVGFAWVFGCLHGVLGPGFVVASMALGLRSCLPKLTLRSGLAVYAGGWCLGVNLMDYFLTPFPFLTWPIIFLAPGFVPHEGSASSQTDRQTAPERGYEPGESGVRRLLRAAGKGNASLAATAFAVALWIVGVSALAMPFGSLRFWYPIDILMSTAIGLYAVFLMLRHGGLFKSRVSRALSTCGLVIAVLTVPGGLVSFSDAFADYRGLVIVRRSLASVVNYVRDEQRSLGTPPSSIAAALEKIRPWDAPGLCVMYQVGAGEFALATRAAARHPDNPRWLRYDSGSAAWTMRSGRDLIFVNVSEGEKVSEREYNFYQGVWNEAAGEETGISLDRTVEGSTGHPTFHEPTNDGYRNNYLMWSDTNWPQEM